MSIQEYTWPAVAPFPPPSLPLHRLSVEQYHRMIEGGVFRENERVELIEGLIVEMTPIGVPHRYGVQELMRALEHLLPDGWELFVGQPITLGGSEPQPDLAIVRGKNSNYRDRNPGPGEIALLVEVADTSLQKDRLVKSRVYADAGIPIFWIVDVAGRQVEVHRDPGPADAGGAAYRSSEVVPATGKITLVLDGCAHGEIEVASILP